MGRISAYGLSLVLLLAPLTANGGYTSDTFPRISEWRTTENCSNGRFAKHALCDPDHLLSSEEGMRVVDVLRGIEGSVPPYALNGCNYQDNATIPGFEVAVAIAKNFTGADTHLHGHQVDHFAEELFTSWRQSMQSVQSSECTNFILLAISMNPQNEKITWSIVSVAETFHLSSDALSSARELANSAYDNHGLSAVTETLVKLIGLALANNTREKIVVQGADGRLHNIAVEIDMKRSSQRAEGFNPDPWKPSPSPIPIPEIDPSVNIGRLGAAIVILLLLAASTIPAIYTGYVYHRHALALQDEWYSVRSGRRASDSSCPSCTEKLSLATEQSPGDSAEGSARPASKRSKNGYQLLPSGPSGKEAVMPIYRTCGHTFCKKCSNRLTECPICNEEIEVTDLEPANQTILSKRPLPDFTANQNSYEAEFTYKIAQLNRKFAWLAKFPLTKHLGRLETVEDLVKLRDDECHTDTRPSTVMSLWWWSRFTGTESNLPERSGPGSEHLKLLAPEP